MPQQSKITEAKFIMSTKAHQHIHTTGHAVKQHYSNTNIVDQIKQIKIGIPKQIKMIVLSSYQTNQMVY